MRRLSLKSCSAVTAALALVCASVATYPETAFAQGPKTTRGALHYCMAATFPEMIFNYENPNGPTAFDSASGRNFVFENDRWIDVKTGKSVCPESSPAIAQPHTGGQVGSVPSAQPKLPADQGIFYISPFANEVLALHNTTRAEYGAPALKWDEGLALRAGAWAGELAKIGRLEHSPREGRGTARENLAQVPLNYSDAQIVGRWSGEKADFVPGIFPNVCRSGGTCDGVLHISQMIWPTTTALGCGKAIGQGSQFVVCYYNPGGNKDGKMVGLPQNLVSFSVGPARTDLDVNVTSGSSGARDDRVNRDASTNVLIDQLFKGPAAYQWIDVKTGKSAPVVTATFIAVGTTESSWTGAQTVVRFQPVKIDPSDPNRAFVPATGQNLVRDDKGKWIDTKTGKSAPVATGTFIAVGETVATLTGAQTITGFQPIKIDPSDPTRAFVPKTGQNLAQVSAPK